MPKLDYLFFIPTVYLNDNPEQMVLTHNGLPSLDYLFFIHPAYVKVGGGGGVKI